MSRALRDAIIEELNYHSDHRVRGGRRRTMYDFDEAAMTLSDGDSTVPARFIVCPTCDGRGSHVNPSIDCNGISAEDFRDDPEFEAEYFGYDDDYCEEDGPRRRRGVYDVPCYECDGKRVVPRPAEGHEGILVEMSDEDWYDRGELLAGA